MLNVLKWVYDLGVKQERERIRRVLHDERSVIDLQRMMLQEQDREQIEVHHERIDFDKAIKDRIDGLLDQRYDPQPEKFKYYSLIDGNGDA